MLYEKARNLQQDILKDYIFNHKQETKHFFYVDGGGNNPNKKAKIDLYKIVNGIAVVPFKEGWRLKVYTEKHVDIAAVSKYLKLSPSDFFVDNVGPIRIQQHPEPGNSICHPVGSMGTLGAYVRDKSGEVYLLSNNHVLSNFFNGGIGDIIVHPGWKYEKTDIIGYVDRLMPVKFNSGDNEVDCGLAKITNWTNPSNTLPGVGRIKGVTQPKLGMKVQKTGFETKLTIGTVTALNASVRVNYSPDRRKRILADFVDQLEITPNKEFFRFSGEGDSGSLITTEIDGNTKAIGLIFAGAGNGISFGNQIKKVLDPLLVEIL